MNPSPADISGGMHVLALNELDHTGSLEIALSVAEYFALELTAAKQVAGEVARAITSWMPVAERMGIRQHEIERMSSAFPQEDIETALSYRTVVAGAEHKRERKKPSAGKQKKSRSKRAVERR
jgi:hypothetical protein